MDKTKQLLKELTEAHGVPGYEAEIRNLIRSRLEEVGKIEQDRIGSLVCSVGEKGPKVMLAAHMDEVPIQEGEPAFRQIPGNDTEVNGMTSRLAESDQGPVRWTVPMSFVLTLFPPGVAPCGAVHAGKDTLLGVLTDP